MGDAFVRMKKSAKAIKAYQRALVLKPGEILITDKITKIYRDAAEEEIAAGNLAQAIQFLQSALRIRPGDREVFGRLFAILVREKKLKELSDLADGMTTYARKTRCADVAINACQLIVRELPRNAAFRKKLINLYLDFDMRAEATEEMVTLARQYMERGQAVKAQDMMEKIRRTGGTGDTRMLLQELEGEKGRLESGPSRKQLIARVAIIVLLLFAVYEAWTFKLWTELQSSHVYAEALSTTDVATQLLPGPEEARASQLDRDCESFLRWHPLSFFRSGAQRLGAKVKERARELRALRESRVTSVLAQANVHLREGRKHVVEELVKPLLKLEPEDPFRLQAEEMIGDLKKHQNSAEELLEKAQSLELAEDWKGAYRAYRQILDAYPRSQIAKDLRIPVLIQSLPPGLEVSEVTANGQRKPLGRTPHVLNLVPEGSLEIEVAAPGYTPVRAEVQVIDGHERRFVLHRKPAWRAALDGAIEVPPVIHGRRIIAGTQKGTLQCLAIEDGQAVWTRPGEAIKSIVAPPLIVEEGLFTVWNNGKLLRLPLDHATLGVKETGTQAAPEFFLGSLATSPLHPLKGRGLVLIGTKSGHLQAYDRKTLASSWSLPVEGLVAAIEDLEGQDLAVVTHSGALLRVGGEPLRVIWKRQLTQGEPFTAFPAGKAIVVWTRAGDLSLLRSSDGITLLSKDLRPGAAVAMARGNDRLFILEKDGTLNLLEPETAAVLKTTSVEAQNAGVEALPNGVVVYRNGRKRILLLDAANLTPLWEASLDREVKTVIGADRWFIAVTADGVLTAFER
jgi:tetratricopeptide (TPR) repeat protein/outer membrane protein assembly factor BamB